MPVPDPKSWTYHRARMGYLSKVLPAGDPQIEAERQALKAALAAAKNDAHIRALVDSAPRLTERQRAILAGLLAPYPGGATG